MALLSCFGAAIPVPASSSSVAAEPLLPARASGNESAGRLGALGLRTALVGAASSRAPSPDAADWASFMGAASSFLRPDDAPSQAAASRREQQPGVNDVGALILGNLVPNFLRPTGGGSANTNSGGSSVVGALSYGEHRLVADHEWVEVMRFGTGCNAATEGLSAGFAADCGDNYTRMGRPELASCDPSSPPANVGCMFARVCSNSEPSLAFPDHTFRLRSRATCGSRLYLA